MDWDKLGEIGHRFGNYGIEEVRHDDIEWLVDTLREAWTRVGDLERQVDTLRENLQDAWLVAKAQQ